MAGVVRGADGTLYGNAITATNPSAENPFNTGEYTNTGGIDLTNSFLTRSSALTASSAADRFSATNFTIATTPDTTKYFALTLTPTSGSVIDFTSLSISLQRSGTGPTSFSVRSSLDSYGTDIATGTLSGTAAVTYTVDLSATTFNAISSAITFEVFEYGGSSTAGTGSINDFAFIGSVPEPATFLGGFLMVGALGWNQRRRLDGLAGLLSHARAA